MDNKEKILAKALVLFARKGYEAAGVQEICDSCGITKPTLYHYYGSKRGLLDSLLETRYAGFLQRLKSAAEYHRDLVVNLESIALSFFLFAKSDPDFSRFTLSASYSPPESEAFAALKNYLYEINATVEKLFRLASEDHGNMKAFEKLHTASFIGIINSYCGMFLGGAINLDVETARQAVKKFMHGIFS